jgi:Flp pilus assembly protein TadD
MVRQEISLAPDDLRPRLLEIRLLLAQSQQDATLWEAARLAADAAVEGFPERPDPLHFRAIVHLQKGDTESAETDLRQALVLAPTYVPAQNDLAYLLMGTDRLDEARTLLQAILDAHPDDALARQRWQALQRQQGTETP